MTLQWYARDNDGVITEITHRVQIAGSAERGTDGMVTNAEQGTVGRMQLRVDDPLGTFEIVGHRVVYAVESEATGDEFGGRVYTGYVSMQTIVEGHPWDGTGCVWILDLDDQNTVLDRRIMMGEDAIRSDETDVERMQWLINTNELVLVDSDAYLSEEDPVAVDGDDLRKQRVRDIIDDLAQHSGKNYYLLPLAGPGQFTQWYGADSLETFEAGLRISNDPADQDADTFIPMAGSQLKRDPARVVSGMVVDYDGGYVYVKRPSTQEAFAIGGRDATIAAPNVKTKAKAIARGNRVLNDVSTQELVIKTAIIVPAARVNDLMWGHRVEAKFTWMPGFTDFTWCRVLNRTVRPLNESLYEITVELSPPVTPPPAAPVDGILYRSAGPHSTVVYWDFPGDTPGAGYVLRPTAGLISPILDGSPPEAGYPYSGWLVEGTGEVDVTFFASVIGVLTNHTEFTVTFAIRLNGVVVADESVAVSGHLEFWSHEQSVSIAGLAVEPDDVIDATITCSPSTMEFFGTPAGTGQRGERLEITGGTLA